MRQSPRPTLVLGFLLAAGAAGCASYPEEQLKLAQAAMDEAGKLQAESFASANWEDAKKAWDEAQTQLEQKRYALAAASLARARSRFEKAREIARAKRATVLEEIKRSQLGINVNYTSLKSSMTSARLAGAVRSELEERCRKIDELVERLGVEVDQGDYVKAQATAKEALLHLQEAQTRIDSVARKRP